mmetsp:Transcript_42753/g.72131  ORF Transcript_42753/g.72131 Transcript_42753/m.72131 type:complete len:97 (-) Transcript_42753:546-836(-)
MGTAGVAVQQGAGFHEDWHDENSEQVMAGIEQVFPSSKWHFESTIMLRLSSMYSILGYTCTTQCACTPPLSPLRMLFSSCLPTSLSSSTSLGTFYC